MRWEADLPGWCDRRPARPRARCPGPSSRRRLPRRSRPVPLVSSLFQLAENRHEIGIGGAHVLCETLALVGVHQWNGGADTAKGGVDVIYVVDEADEFSGSCHNDSCSFCPLRAMMPYLRRVLGKSRALEAKQPFSTVRRI